MLCEGGGGERGEERGEDGVGEKGGVGGVGAGVHGVQRAKEGQKRSQRELHAHDHRGEALRLCGRERGEEECMQQREANLRVRGDARGNGRLCSEMERQHLRHELAEAQLREEPHELPKAPQDRSAVQQQQTVLARWLLLPVQQEEQVVQAGTQRPRQAQQAVASYQRGVEGGVAVLREAEEDAEQLVGQPAVEGAGEEERGGGGQRIADDVRRVEERVGHIRVMLGL